MGSGSSFGGGDAGGGVGWRGRDGMVSVAGDVDCGLWITDYRFPEADANISG